MSAKSRHQEDLILSLSNGRLVFLAALVACTQSSGGPNITLPDGAGTARPQAPRLNAFVVSLSKDSVAVGESATAVAVIRDQFGNQFPGGIVLWSVTPAEKATVSADGVVTATAPGLATVWANQSGIASGNASIVIR